MAATRLAVLGSTLVALGAAAALAVSSPALSSADEAAHLDYAYQVWLGQLPEFHRGLIVLDGLDLPPEARIPSAQWTSQHPPLFYLVAAPLLGPPADDGRWVQATLAGRAVPVLLTALLIPLVAWSASRLRAGGSGLVLGAAAAAVAASLPLVVVTGAALYNDMLAVVATVAALGTAVAVVRGGLTRARLAVAVAVGSVGMSTRAAFVVTLAVLALAVALGPLLHGRGTLRRRCVRAVGAAALVVGGAAAASGWFYLRNIRLTGSWTGAQPEFARTVLRREQRSAWEVVSSQRFWVNYSDWWLRPDHGPAQWLSVLVPALLVVSAGVALGQRLRRSRGLGRVHPGDLVLALHVGLLVAMQVVYNSRAGGISVRYLLPAVLAVAVLLACGALVWSRGWPWLLGLAPVASSFFVLPRLDVPGTFAAGATAAGVPAAVVAVALAVCALGVLTQAAGLLLLARRRVAVGSAGPT